MEYPKVYLTLDNCFAIKRWVEPREWMPLIKKIGFSSVQASFDNEIDFLYSPDWYLDWWFKELEEQENLTGIKADTFFTGYQTYRTAALAHPVDAMADYLEENWVEKAIRRLGKRGSHMGMSFYAIPDNVLQDPQKYQEVTGKAISRMGKIAACAKENGIYFCMEAMYAPHQPPWTVGGAKKFLKDCYEAGGAPVYLTIDVGHMIGQDKFRKPSVRQLEKSLTDAVVEGKPEKLWLGSRHTRSMWEEAVGRGDCKESTAEAIFADMENWGYLFSDGEGDSDPYCWLGELGCYSPIIHMQQTNGITASHAAFTEEENKRGIIEGERVLRALARSYVKESEPGMPEKSRELYLAFEIFAGNTEYTKDIIKKLKDTAVYWRQFIPEDGIRLNELIDRLDRKVGKNESLHNG